MQLLSGSESLSLASSPVGTCSPRECPQEQGTRSATVKSIAPLNTATRASFLLLGLMTGILAEFAHLQPYIAYGVGGTTTTVRRTRTTDGYETITPFTTTPPSHSPTSGWLWSQPDSGTDRQALAGLCKLNYFVESQTIEFDDGDAVIRTSIQPDPDCWSGTGSAAPVKTIDPKASFFWLLISKDPSPTYTISRYELHHFSDGALSQLWLTSVVSPRSLR